MIDWVLGIREVKRGFVGESALFAGGVQSRDHVIVAAGRDNGGVAEIGAAGSVGGYARVRAPGKSTSIDMVADDWTGARAPGQGNGVSGASRRSGGCAAGRSA